MPQVRVVDYQRNRAYKAEYEERQGKIFFKNGPVPRDVFGRVLTILKGLEGARWHPDEKLWSFKSPEVSQRNRFLLGYLTGGDFPGTVKNPYAAYDTPVCTMNNSNVNIKRPLKGYQIEDLAFILQRKRCIYAADMGLGKTLVAIEAMERVNPKDCWVFAPLAPLKAWESELRKWKAQVRPRLMSCDQSAFMKAMKAARTPPQFVVLDESSRYKNFKAKRSQLAHELQRLMEDYWGDNCYLIEMTGTPAPKDPSDWWSQAEIARPGFLVDKTPVKLKERLAHIEREETPSGGMFSRVVGWKPDEIELLYKRLNGLVKIRRKKDCLDLPEKLYQEIQLPLDEQTLRIARMIASQSTRSVELLMKLRQLSDGFQYGDKDLDEPTVRVHTPKDDALKGILESFVSEEKFRIVIYGGFTETVDKVTQLCQEADWGVIRVDGRGWKAFGEIQATLEQFQELDQDKPIAFVANADAGGMGITLTASDTIVYYSNSFNAEARIQSEDRIYRIGTKGANIIDLLHLPTDKMVLDNLKRKRTLQSISLGEVVETIDKINHL